MLPCCHTHGVRIDLAEAPCFGRPADGRMLRQRYLTLALHLIQSIVARTLADPAILSIVSPDEYDKVIPNSIVGVKKVGNDSNKSQPASEYDKFIFGPELREEVCTISTFGPEVRCWSLYLAGIPAEVVNISSVEAHWRQLTKGNDNFTGGFSLPDGIWIPSLEIAIKCSSNGASAHVPFQTHHCLLMWNDFAFHVFPRTALGIDPLTLWLTFYQLSKDIRQSGTQNLDMVSKQPALPSRINRIRVLCSSLLEGGLFQQKKPDSKPHRRTSLFRSE